jgi:hypothetical protein
MLKDIFGKIKSVFTGTEKENEKNPLNAVQQISNKVKEKYQSEEVFLNLLKQFQTKSIFNDESLILFSKTPEKYQVSQASYLFKGKNPKVINVNSSSDYNEQEKSVLYIVNDKNLINKAYKVLQYVKEGDEIMETDYYFFGNVISSIEYFISQYDLLKEKVIGWSASKSIYERGKGILSFFTKQNFQIVNNDNNLTEQQIMEKMKNGSLDFNDILFIFSKLKEISAHPVASMLGFKLTPEKEKVILQQKAIISAMTSKERKNFDLVSKNQSRKERIAKGSGVNIMQVDQLLNVINSLREKSGDIAKMAGNPNQLMEMMKNFKI